ncbi:bifunctional protein-serine/threonine kinase/phosphatase [Parathalassolituus penaei]|uniref:Protein kinase n=1 Tax=Parathalassolituus penaei TaxID=2997323 RepID=A0A9X3EGX6_9GAMM|nr:bifunctional protein-serine/threonine kinase/phosphatase [Parathalassolituus penaei]MCY0966544.1 protein kinase [Parathalassolituus penaei]
MSVLDVQFGGVTTAGKREINQDAFAIHQSAPDNACSKGVGACIADGISSSLNAQQASATSVTHFLQDYFSTPDEWDVKTAAARVLVGLNSWLYHHGRQASAQANALVTTFSGLIIKDHSAHLFHVGDSRIYLWRDGVLEQLTRDHIHTGSGQAFLSRALGMDSRLEVDYQQRDVQAGDVFLLCSDGVHNRATRAAMVDVVTAVNEKSDRQQLEALCRRLVDNAIDAGSEDNATCLLLRVNALGIPQPEVRRVETGKCRLPPLLNEGDSLDQFLIQELVYTTHRSHIYRALNRRNGRICALKVPSAGSGNDALCEDIFARERWVGSHVCHPNLMRIHDDNHDSQYMYHVCEWIEGISLRQWMFDHPQPGLSDVRKIAEQLVQGLRALQRVGIVHRDLKPENVMIDREGVVKILDFGSVSARGLRESQPLDRGRLPRSSCNYVAPEYVLQGESSSQTDLFALAVIVAEMLAGRTPFLLDDLAQRKQCSRADWQYRPVRDIRSDVPLWLELALRKGCHPDPRQRYVAFSEFLTDLHQPNDLLIEQAAAIPFWKREPLQFWKSVAIGATLVAVLEALLFAL